MCHFLIGLLQLICPALANVFLALRFPNKKTINLLAVFRSWA
jgi:hypothetical protein